MAKPITIRILGDSKGLEKTITHVDGLFDQMGGAATKAAGLIGATFGAAQAASFFKGTIGAASDLQETISKTGVIFGDSAGEIEEWADRSAEAIGQSKQQALDAATTFATFGKSAGLTGQELAGFAQELTGLSTDLASFHNADPSEVIQALGAALRGEAEPARRFGILLDDATLRTAAFKAGLISSTKDALTPATKVMAAYHEIIRQTKDAQGDYQRTADGVANTERRVAAEWQNSKTKIGEVLLPVYGQLVNTLSTSVIPTVEKVIPPVTELVGFILELTSGVLGVVSAAGPAITVLGSFGLSAGAAGLAVKKISDVSEGVIGSLKTLGATVTTVGGAFGILASLAAGVAAAAFISVRQRQQEAKETADRLAEAYREAQDPTQQLADRMTELAEKLQGVSKDTEGAEQAAEVGTDAWTNYELAQRKVIDITNKVGLSAKDVSEIVKSGSDIFEVAQTHIKDYGQTTDQVREILGRYDHAEQQRVAAILDAVDAGRISADQAGKLLSELDKLADATDDHREAMTAQMQAGLQAALSAEKINQAWLQQHGIVDIGTAKLDQLTAASEALEASQAGAAPAVAEVGDAGKTQAEGLDEAKRAADEAESSLRELKRATDDYLLHAVDYEGAVDGFTRSVNEMAKQFRDTGTDITGNSDAALKNRDALREIVTESANVVEKLREAGGTADQQKGALAFLAGQFYDNATAAGLTADEADRVRQKILAIPTDVTINVKVRKVGDEISVTNPDGTTLRYLASGGQVGGRGGAVRVGERGPETVVLPPGAAVVANHAGGSGNGGGVVVNVAKTNASAWEIGREVEWAMRTAGR